MITSFSSFVLHQLSRRPDVISHFHSIITVFFPISATGEMTETYFWNLVLGALRMPNGVCTHHKYRVHCFRNFYLLHCPFWQNKVDLRGCDAEEAAILYTPTIDDLRAHVNAWPLLLGRVLLIVDGVSTAAHVAQACDSTFKPPFLLHVNSSLFLSFFLYIYIYIYIYLYIISISISRSNRGCKTHVRLPRAFW